MSSFRRAARRFETQESRKDWVASQVGIPMIGSKMVNKHGIEWQVRDHAPLPTVYTINRWNSEGLVPAEDLYPVVEPINISPKLLEFLLAIDRCTTKSFAIVDTMPGRRKDGHIPNGNFIDTVCHPVNNVLFLDAARIDEAVIAHELGHAWLQYVERCEDLRTCKPEVEPAKAKMVANIQSYVLDLRVNALLQEKDFDISSIELDQAASLDQLATALKSGYRPHTAREEVFMALLVADAKLRLSSAETTLACDDRSISVIRSARPEMDRLADSMARSVARHGHGSSKAVEASVNDCLLAAFCFAREDLDLETDLVPIDPPEPDRDKFPEWLPCLTPTHKCEVGRHMALNDISFEWPHWIEPTLAGRARIVFTAPDQSRRTTVVVNQRFGPPTHYEGMSETYAEAKELMRQNEERRHRGMTPPRPLSPMPQQSTLRDTHSLRNARSYMAGTGRFLTAVRQAEWAGGEHPYGYAFDNPATYVDPTGNRPLCARAGQKPCSDLMPKGPKPEDLDKLIACLRKAGTDRSKIIDCAKAAVGSDIQKWIPYLSCVAAADQNTDLSGPPYLDPCNPPNDNYALLCCHSKYLACVVRCKGSIVNYTRCLVQCIANLKSCQIDAETNS